MGSFKKLVGDRIVKAREAAGLTQLQLVALMNKIDPDLNVDRTRVSRWEGGENSPTGARKAALLKALNASEEDIFGREAPPPPPKTVAEMPVSEFKAALAAPKHDDLEFQRLKRLVALIPEKDCWEKLPDVEDPSRAFALFFVTLNPDHLKGVKREFVKEMMAAFRFHGLSPMKKPTKGKK